MPRRKIYTSVWRDIMSHKAQFAGVIIMIALGAGSLGVFIPGYLNLSSAYDYTYHELALADFRITTVLQTDTMDVNQLEEIMNEFSEEYPIKSYEYRLVIETTAVKNTTKGIELVTIRMIGANATGGRHPSVNDVEVTNGRWFVDSDNWNPSSDYNEYVALTDARFAEYHNFQPNARINILVDGSINETTEVRIIGSFGSAEHLWIAASWQDIMPSSKRFGIFCMPLSSLQNLMGFEFNEVNDICIILEEGTSESVRDNVMKSLEATMVAHGFNVLPPIPKEQEPSYAGLELDIEGMAEMVFVFPLFILILAVFSTYVTMSRLVSSQRQEVGVLMAVGHSRRDIYSKYLSYGVIVAVLGWVIGVFTGEFTARWFTEVYLGMIKAPFRIYGLYPDIMVAELIISLAVCLIGSIIPARSIAKMIPAKAMRDDPANVISGRVTLAEKAFKKVSGWEPRISSKIVLRNLFRSRRRSVSTLIGILMSFVLLAATFGANDSFEATMDYMAVREGWDLQVQYLDFKMDSELQADLDVIQSWNEVESAFRAITFSTVLSSTINDFETVLQVRIQDPQSSVHNFKFGTEGGSFSDAGIVVTEATAEKLEVGLGDDIKVMHPVFNITSLFPLRYSFEMINSSLSVSGISEETTSLVCWISYAQAEDMMGSALLEANTVYITLKNNSAENIDRVKQRIYTSIVDVRSALSSQDIAYDMSSYLETMKMFLYILITFSVMLAASIVLTTSVINVLERRREVATILTLGAPFNYSQKAFLWEGLIVTTSGIILGIPFAYLALFELGASFSTDFFEFITIIKPVTSVISAAIIVLTTIIVQWLFVRRFNKMDLAQETKRRIT
jgi:putative ABC transport system permease protein